MTEIETGPAGGASLTATGDAATTATRNAASDSAHRADSKHLARASLFVIAASLLAKLLGSIRDVASAAIFGASRAMDGFAIARTLPDMVSTWIEMPVRSAFVPLFTRTLHERGEQEAWRVASNVINCLAVFLALVVVALVFLAEPMVVAFSPGFQDPATWQESAGQARILVISILFSVLAVILGSLLNIYRRQALTSLGQIVSGALVLGGVLWLGPRLGLNGFALAILAGAVATCLIQSQVLWSHRAHYRFTLQPRAPEVRELLALALPLFVGLTGTRIDVIIDRIFVSFLHVGDLAVMVYAIGVANVAADVVLTAAQSVLLPHFAHLIAQKQTAEVRRRLAQSIEGYLLLMLPMAAFLCAAALPLVDLLFRRGKFTAENAALAAVLLPLLAIQAPAHGAGQIMAQAHIAAGNTRTPMVVGFWRIGFKLLLSIVLIPWLGIAGLALSSSLSAWFRAFLLWKRLDPELRPEGARMRGQGGKLLAVAVAAGLLVWGVALAIPAQDGTLERLLLAGGLGALTLILGLGGAWVLRVDAARTLGSLAKRR